VGGNFKDKTTTFKTPSPELDKYCLSGEVAKGFAFDLHLINKLALLTVVTSSKFTNKSISNELQDSPRAFLDTCPANKKHPE